MKALAFSPAAEADIEGIWDYSADNWGPDQADRYTDEIRDAWAHLRKLNPKPGAVEAEHAATFLRWRDDKPPSDCRYDQLEVTPAFELSAVFGASRGTPRPARE